VQVSDLGIPGYESARVVGRGALGVVYCARQIGLDRTVAIKVFHGQTANESTTAFRRECRTLGQIDSCPQIITVYGTGVTERGDLYLVMEHCPGGSLADRLLNRGPLTEVQSLAVGAEVTTALKYAHREGVLHRGVKPENILMSRSGRPVLSDFGMGRLANPQTMLVGVTGTIGFTAPEVLKGEQSTVASDVWSVGALLHVLVSGRSPYATTDRDTIRTMIVRAIAGGELTAANLSVSEGLRTVMDRCLKRNPSERPADADVLTAELNDVIKGAQGRGLAPQTVAEPGPPAARSDVLTATAAAPTAPTDSVPEVPLAATIRRGSVRVETTAAEVEGSSEAVALPSMSPVGQESSRDDEAESIVPSRAEPSLPEDPSPRKRRGTLVAGISAALLTVLGMTYAHASTPVARLVNGTVRVERGIAFGNTMWGSSEMVTRVTPALLSDAQRRALTDGITIPDTKDRDKLIAELRMSSKVSEARLHAARKPWPDGNQISFSWEQLDIRPGLTTTLATEDGRVLANCPHTVSASGACTTTIDWGGRVRVVLLTKGMGQSVKSVVTIQADAAPALSIAPQAKYTNSEGTFCGSLITISGLEPGTKIPWAADMHGNLGTVDHFDYAGDDGLRVTGAGDGQLRMGWGPAGLLSSVTISAAGLSAELDLSGCQ